MGSLPAELVKPSDLSPEELLALRLRRVPELLSPAGDWEAMRAAVANGADAVYFGLDQFNARHRATNFRLDELDEIMRYLHSHNVRGFLTLNTLIFSDELSEVQAYIRRVAAAGVDAVIVQDLGVCRLIRAVAPSLEIHGSTQMTLTEPRGVEWVKRLGVTRAVLGRELSLDEIRKTALGLAEREKATGERMPDLEVFVHGALCVSYSGQCLTSESLGGRSANRGQCAQACRLPYDLIVDGEKRELGEKAYLLSPQDLAAYDLVEDLAEAGVACLKIEGRLKAAHYVAATTQTYRAAIEAVAAEKPYAISPQQRADLEQTFSRGFTHGFLSGVNHQELVHARFPKSRGRRIGTVESAGGGRGKVFTIAMERGVDVGALVAGDGIVFDEGHPEQDEQGGRVYAVKPVRRGKTVMLEVELFRGDANLGAVSVGAIVWKTDDPGLRKRLEHSFSRDVLVRRTAVRAKVVARVGARLSLEMTDGVTRARAEWEERVLEKAQKHPAEAAVIREQLERLGDTPYELSEVEVVLEGGPMVPKSVINELRRKCTEQLLSGREGRRGHVVVEGDGLERLRGEASRLRVEEPFGEGTGGTPGTQKEELEASGGGDSALGAEHGRDAHATRMGALGGGDSGLRSEHGRAAHATGWRRLHVLVRDLEQLEAVLAWREKSLEVRELLGSVYADFEDVRRYRGAVSRCREAGVSVALATVRVIKPREEGFTRFIVDCGPDALLVRNLASLVVAQEMAPGMPLIGDYSMNVSNELTAALLAESGLVRMVPSYDLSWKQMQAMLGRIDAGWFECVVHQHMPMFHMEHCVFSHVLSNGTDYRTCGRPCERHKVELRDRVGEGHPLLADVGCRNTVFNSQAQSALEYMPGMMQAGVRHFRVELLREGPEEVEGVLDRYAAVMLGRVAPAEAVRSLRVVAQLGVTRGTLDRE